MSNSTAKRRSGQRQRTRAALVQAAVEAVRKGQTPTVEEAAEAAGVSRATAYRYFGSQQALLLEVSLEGMNAAPASTIGEGPVEARLDAAVRGLVGMAWEHEPYLRTFLMLSLERWLQARKSGAEGYPVRKGRRLAWLERALEPLRSLTPRQDRRLRVALSMLCGVEAMIVAKDVCGCTQREAEDASRWAAQVLLQAAERDVSLLQILAATQRGSKSD